MSGINIDLTGVEVNDGGGGWKALPDGEYNFLIVGAEMRDLKSGNGQALSLKLQQLGGKGAILFENLNVVHNNPKAQGIARRVLAGLLDATGIVRDGLTNTEQLVGHQVAGSVKRRKSRPGYGDSDGYENSVNAFGPPVPPAEQGQGSPGFEAQAEPFVAGGDIPF
jgi:hypothetical protein